MLINHFYLMIFFTLSISMALADDNNTVGDFNISKASSDDYIKLMRDARRKLGVKISSYQLPILPRSTQQIQFKDMLLQADDRNMIRLRLRWDNLYLVGFQMNASRQQGQAGGKWKEFDPDTQGAPKLIPNSTYLGFTGGYDALLRASNGDYLENVNIGKDSLLEAVLRLNNAGTKYDLQAKSLIVVLIMICESLRYTYITDSLNSTFVNRLPIKPNPRTVALMKNWAKLSELLLVREQSPTHYFPSNPPPAAMEIHNYLDAVAVLGILKEETPVKTTTTTTTLRTTTTTTIVDNDEQQYYYYPLGEPMVEVIWVKIDSVCDDLYGAIQVTDGAGSQYLYKTTRDDSVKTKPGDDQLILQHDPVHRSILAYDSFTIDVDLKDAGHNTNTNTNTNNSRVIQGKISWNVFNTFSNVYDQPLEQVIKGECGSVTMKYVVLSDAVKAKLEVTLIKGDHGAETTHVCGDITARIGKFKEGCVIFKKASNEPISITSGQLIPLLKSAVAVPLNSSIIVEANISSVPDVDDGFAKYCSVEFPALLSGSSEKSISGKSGEIRVKVTWDRETY